MRRFVSLWALAALMFASPASAQDIDELEDEGLVLETPFEIGIEPGAWEFSAQFGYLNLDQVLLSAEGIIVDVEDAKAAIFADMELVGESSFHPQVRIGRNFGSHFSVDVSAGLSVGDFEQRITSPLQKWVDEEEEDILTDNERQKGSYIVLSNELSMAYYPRGKGRIQPYIIGGVGQRFFELDSAYVDGMTSSIAYSYGAGLRVIGDDLYSFRLEIRNYHSTLQFDTASTFVTRPNLAADGLIDVPISRLVDTDDLSPEEIQAILDQLDLSPGDIEVKGTDGVSRRVPVLPVAFGDFEEQSISTLWISLGFTAAF